MSSHLLPLTLFCFLRLHVSICIISFSCCLPQWKLFANICRSFVLENTVLKCSRETQIGWFYRGHFRAILCLVDALIEDHQMSHPQHPFLWPLPSLEKEPLVLCCCLSDARNGGQPEDPTAQHAVHPISLTSLGMARIYPPYISTVSLSKTSQ